MHRWQAAPGKPDEWSVSTNLDETMQPGFADGPNKDGRYEAAGVDAEMRQLVHACQTNGAARFGRGRPLAEFGERNEAGDCIGAKMMTAASKSS